MKVSKLIKDIVAGLANAYKDGISAAYRTGKYTTTYCPACQFKDGNQTSLRWWTGFGDATEDLIYLQAEGFADAVKSYK